MGSVPCFDIRLDIDQSSQVRRTLTNPPCRARISYRASPSPFASARYGKRERRPRTIVGADPKTASVALDDGATHRKANAHTARLGRVERLEKLVHGLKFENHTRVPDAQASAIPTVSPPNFLRSYTQITAPSWRAQTSLTLDSNSTWSPTWDGPSSRPVHAADNPAERKCTLGAPGSQLFERFQHPIRIEATVSKMCFRVRRNRNPRFGLGAIALGLFTAGA